MSSKLSKSNPFLRDPAVREKSVMKSVAGSSAIEGIHAPFRKPVSGALKGSASPSPKIKRQALAPPAFGR